MLACFSLAGKGEAWKVQRKGICVMFQQWRFIFSRLKRSFRGASRSLQEIDVEKGMGSPELRDCVCAMVSIVNNISVCLQ